MIITFASSKGGVGKSTSCVALAGAYVKAGARVHIVDLDNNRTVSRWLADDKTRPDNLTVSVPDPQILTEHLQEAGRHYAPDKILIDVAGNYERALTVAIARAHLTLIPASTTEADIYEAARIAKHIQTIYAAFGKTPLYRVLATRIFALALADNSGWTFALELDRGNEDIGARRIKGKATYLRKVLGYFIAWREGVHISQWGEACKAFRVLVVTTSETRIQNMSAMQEHVGAPAGLFLYSTPERLKAHGALGPAWISAKRDGISLIDRE